MNLIEVFEKQVNDKVIETLISKLFFRGDKVYKVYKWDKAFFGDFSSLTFRKDFYQEDFFWNHAMAPHIYLELKSVKFEGDKFVEANIENAEDFYILMNKIDDTESLTNRLISGNITTENLRLIAREMTERIQKLTEEKIGGLNHLVKKGWKSLETEIIVELRKWCYMAEPQYPKQKIDNVIDKLQSAFEKENYFDNFDNSKLSLCIDNHSDNVLFSDGKVGFLDIFLPKESWRIVDPFYNISRLATDVAILGDKEKALVMYVEYKKILPSIPKNVQLIYELISALIKAPYLYVLKKPELADKYVEFIDQKILELGS